MVHEEGLLWRSLRASCALPGIIPPIIENGDLLLDGGLLKNLPVDIMQSRCDGGYVIAVDVSPKVELESSAEFGDSISGWEALWSQIIPGKNASKAPHILSILMQATVLSSRYTRAEMLSQNNSLLYLNPPVHDFKMLDFQAMVANYRYWLSVCFSKGT